MKTKSEDLVFSKPYPLAPDSNAKKRKDGKYEIEQKGYAGGKKLIKAVPIGECIYYWWFEYLKRSDKYKEACSNNGKGMKRLYADFGNIFEYKTNKSGFTYEEEFWKWWSKRGQFLFCEKPVQKTTYFISLEDAVALKEKIQKDEYRLIAIPTNLNKSIIRKRLGELITKLDIEGKKGKEDAVAKYRISNSHVDVESLKECLRAYDLSRAGMGHRKVFLNLYGMNNYEYLATEDFRRRKRGLLLDWEETGSEDFEDWDNLPKQSKKELLEAAKLEVKIEEIVDKKMEWRLRRGAKDETDSDNERRDLNHGEVFDLREMLSHIEYGTAKRVTQPIIEARYKKYMHTYISRKLNKANANIDAVTEGFFSVSSKNEFEKVKAMRIAGKRAK